LLGIIREGGIGVSVYCELVLTFMYPCSCLKTGDEVDGRCCPLLFILVASLMQLDGEGIFNGS